MAASPWRCWTDVNGEEKKAVLAVLEAEHPSADVACKATYDTVLDVLKERDSYVVGVNIGTVEEPFWVPYGPFWGMQAANKFRKLVGLSKTDIRPVYGPAGLTLDSSTRKHCPNPECEHPWLAHSYGTQCIVPGCTCTMTWSARGWAGE